MEERLKENKKAIENQTTTRPLLVHGDLGDNIRRDDGNLYVIDWELSRFAHGPELGYIIIHGHLDRDQARCLLSSYAREMKRDLKSLEREIARDMKIIKVNDVIWAARRYAQMLERGMEDADKYRKMAFQRKREYREMVNGLIPDLVDV